MRTADPQLIIEAGLALQRGEQLSAAALGALQRAIDSATDPSQPSAGATYILQRCDRGWLVGMDNQRFVITTRMSGFHFLQYLIKNARRDVPVLELVNLGRSGLEIETEYSEISCAAQVLADDQALFEIAAERSRISDALEHEPLTQTERDELLKQRDQIDDYLRASVGSGHRRCFVDDSERARSNVSHRIAAALGKIAERCPELANHLRKHLITGRCCSYAIEPPMQPRWIL